MERLLIRVPLLLVEWLNPVGSGATSLLYHTNLAEGRGFEPLQDFSPSSLAVSPL